MTEPRFALDSMLGSLARWLRIMGYDSTYEREAKDTEILRRSIDEDRFLITRDKQLALRAGEKGFLITSDRLEDQLAQMVKRFGLRSEAVPTRCTICNGALEKVGRNEIMDNVPPRVLERNEEFFRCTSCGQIYWKGTHWEKIRRTLDGLQSGRDQSL